MEKHGTFMEKTWENPDMLGGTILPFKHPPSVLVSSFSLSLSVRFCVERPGRIHSEIDRPRGVEGGRLKAIYPLVNEHSY